MKFVQSDVHKLHAPQKFIVRGEAVRCPEVPERVGILAASMADHESVPARDFGLVPINRIHDDGYLTFLKQAWRRWGELPNVSSEIIPNVHANRNMSHVPEHIIGQAGYYQADTSCPIGPGTWTAAQAATQVALTAADIVLSNNDDHVAYALCRPPGHHAFADMAGGFCYINNTAVAAQYCLDAGRQRVAIVDVDVHHGNGTQGIFYHRSDVLTVSLHGDPDQFFPFYAGYADETGDGHGRGFNRNTPLPRNTSDATYTQALGNELQAVRDFRPEILIIALGLDASEHDPLAFLSVTTQGFEGIGKQLGELGLPTVLIQEGGYVSDILGQNLARFIEGFETTFSPAAVTSC